MPGRVQSEPPTPARPGTSRPRSQSPGGGTHSLQYCRLTGFVVFSRHSARQARWTNFMLPSQLLRMDGLGGGGWRGGGRKMRAPFHWVSQAVSQCSVEESLAALHISKTSQSLTFPLGERSETQYLGMDPKNFPLPRWGECRKKLRPKLPPQKIHHTRGSFSEPMIVPPKRGESPITIGPHWSILVH